MLEPGVIGEAVELKVAEDIRACMERQGQRYDGLAEVPPLMACCRQVPMATDRRWPEARVLRRRRRPPRRRGDRRSRTYEAALYGKLLRDFRPVTPCAVRRCGAQHARRVRGDHTRPALHFDALEADLLADSRTVAAMGDWSECMADRGHRYGSPEEIIIDLSRRLSTLRGEEAASLADEERPHRVG